MDLIEETGEIGHELLGRYSPDTVKNWIIPKRAALLVELKRCGLDNVADARHAFCKIDAVLSWVDRWKTRAAS
jgi:hypothetical protein